MLRDSSTTRFAPCERDAKIKQDYFGKTNATKDQIEQTLIAANIGQADRRLTTELLRMQFQCP